MTDNPLVGIRDPLFVIVASLEIIKHQSSNKSIQDEVKRIEKALDKINKMIS
jgi:hypothetical protein